MEIDVEKFMTEEWPNALTSGEFKQGRGALANKEWDSEGNNVVGVRYCCLGVACELLARKGLLTRIENVNGAPQLVGYAPNSDRELLSLTFLPTEVANALKIAKGGDFKNGRGSLALLNDEGIPFEKIAEEIRLLYTHNGFSHPYTRWED